MSIAGLPDPLREALEVETDEVRLARGWRAIERKQKQAARARVMVAGGGAVALAAAALLAVLAWGDDGAAGPLRPVAVASLDDALRAGHEVAFDDGSVITPEPGARLEPLENDGDRFGVLLRGGTARFSVTPGGPRRWTVAAGIATVEVVGTVFTVERGGEGVRVAVERGEVLVRGDTLPDGVARLRRGESVIVPAVTPRAPTRPMSEDEAAPPAVHDDAPRPVAEGGAESAPRTETPEPAGRAPADRAPESRRVAADERPAIRPSRPSADDGTPVRDTRETGTDDSESLLGAADAARRSGDPERAMAILADVADRDDPQAALAALTRARLALELDRPAEAIPYLRRAIASDRGSLAESARARLVEAYARTGNRAAAQAAAADYRARYPRGPWRAMVDRWAAR